MGPLRPNGLSASKELARLLVLLLALVPIVAIAQQNPHSASDFGGVGLLQTRTARFGDDGQFEVGVSRISPYRRYLLNVQALPWVEGTFRYTEIENRGFFSTGPIRLGETTFKDRGADLKFKLLDESRFVPALAVGLQDGLGTGQFSGEYFVASKRYFDFDLSLGLGWGYNGTRGGIRNPFASLSNAFKTRDQVGGSQFGGTLGFSNWFRGEEVALFGGIEYLTPLKGLSLKLEIEGNDYQSEPLTNRLERSSFFNVGINYRPFPWVEFSLAHERGKLLMFRGSLRANFNALGAPKLDPGPPKLVPRPVPTELAAQRPVQSVARRPLPAPRPSVRSPLADRRIGSNEMAVQSALLEQGITARSAGWVGGTILFDLANVHEMPSRENLDRAADAISTSGFEEVGFRVVGYEGQAQTVYIPLGSVGEQDLVGFFFEGIERLGLTPVDVSFSTGTARVQVLQAVTENLAREIARLSVLISPVPLQQVIVTSKETNQTFTIAKPLRAVSVSIHGATSGATTVNADDSFALDDISQALFEKLVENGLLGEALSFQGKRMTLHMSNLRYTKEAMAMGRAAVLMANHAPPFVEELEIVTIAGGMELARLVVFRGDLERASSSNGSVEEILARATVEDAAPRRIDPSAARNPKRYPATNFSLSPFLRQHVGGGDVFFAYALGLRASAEVELAKGLSLAGSIGHNITDTFDRITVASNSRLPRVRSDVREYLQGSDTGLTRLQVNYLAKLAPDLFGRVSAGMFEEMYGGFGGEILYRPFGARFAAGVDANLVRQRDFLGRFGFRDYTVATGHLNLYYDSPFSGLLFQTAIGRYLAGDLGATFQVSREFTSGVRAGVFTTFTDVPYEIFGEGSFDKGFFISIPLELFLVTRTRRGGTFGFRPLTKDGGQRLSVSPRLYDVTAQGNLKNIVDEWSSLLQ